MNVFGWNISLQKSSPTPAASSKTFQKANIPSGVIVSEPWEVFDGEKTKGELGKPINIVADHRALRMRAYEVNLKADLVKAMTNKFFKWVVGEGLKLQATPVEFILKEEGYSSLNVNELKNQCEIRFNLLSYSKNVHNGGMKNLHDLANDAFSDSFLGGDCIVIFRVKKNGYPTVQVIDGQELVSPDLLSKHYTNAEKSGNEIKHGIEYDKSGSHVAYYIRDENSGIERISAFIEFEKFKFRAVRIIYGAKHRINDLRGISSLSSIIEKIDKLDRFSEASIASAEERANIVYAIEHSKDSTGENPMAEKLLRGVAGNLEGVVVTEDPYKQGEETSKKIYETTAKQAFNMPIGSKMTVLDSDAEFNYDKFLNAVFDHLCAALDIPPEVALQKYSSNYSASRAAINAWQHIVKIARAKFSEEFYQPYYELFFYCQCLMGKLNCSYEYINVAESDDFLLKDAFTNARFVGVNMPHIDPYKEVKAVRELLGDKYKDVPLVSFDQATEQLNQGDFNENISKLKIEVKENNLEQKEDNKE